jgi:murein DD-endopeptidase MepM/ murein hydrolase activator NlpD/SH3-like domain-containing protein
MRKTKLTLLHLACCMLLLTACKTGPVNLFKAATPHEIYLRKLSASGLDKTAMGRAWMDTSNQVLRSALTIKLPYKESGYFAAERVPATSYRFTVVQGQKVDIQLSKVPEKDFMIYMDVWEVEEDNTTKLIASADTTGASLSFEGRENRSYLLRLQPELLRSGSYTLQITTGPSLSFPVKTSGRPRIESLFGVGRDANTRRHEGIDIFDKFHTPVIAAANGTVTRVSENKLGGLVVMMRPEGKDYTLYYAHLDKQIAVEGQQVGVGDTLGLMGKTGNAATTPPHLHFGIYARNGAVNPLPYVNPVVLNPPPVQAPLTNLNATVRSKTKTVLLERDEPGSKALATLPAETVLHIEAAASNWYKATLPNGTTGYIQSRDVLPVTAALRKFSLKPEQTSLYDQPALTAAIRKKLEAGQAVNLLGRFDNYFLVRDDQEEIGWLRQ